MKVVTLPVAYVPLVDAAPLIAAQELGFAEEEGIALELVAAPSWSSLRDMLAFGRVDAAHMLAPMPVAMALGQGGVRTPLSAVSVLSMNGTVIGVGAKLHDALRAEGFDYDFVDAGRAAQALKQVARARTTPLTFGVPFPFSSHVELLRYWLENTVLSDLPVEIRTVPPPLMANALGQGEIDAFVVGEPWGSVAVEQGVGSLLLPGRAIWKGAPEKVLAVRADWGETEPHLLGKLMRAVWRAGRWVGQKQSRVAAAELLARPEWLGLAPELIDRSLSGNLIITPEGETRDVSDFIRFHAGAATFPWRSQAKWIADRMAGRLHLEPAWARDSAGTVFRSDLYRAALAPTGADLPGASEKLEGAILHDTPVASLKGTLTLAPDGFFDGRVFDPAGS